MIVEVQVTINGSKTAVWNTITNIEKAAEIISGIQKIEIVEKPASGIVGLKWRETRMYFGKPATVEIWITVAVENEFYKTRAESDGYLFLSTLRVSESSDGITVTSTHDYKPQSTAAKLKSISMVFFKGMIKKILQQDRGIGDAADPGGQNSSPAVDSRSALAVRLRRSDLAPRGLCRLARCVVDCDGRSVLPSSVPPGCTVGPRSYPETG